MRFYTVSRSYLRRTFFSLYFSLLFKFYELTLRSSLLNPKKIKRVGGITIMTLKFPGTIRLPSSQVTLL